MEERRRDLVTEREISSKTDLRILVSVEISAGDVDSDDVMDQVSRLPQFGEPDERGHAENIDETGQSLDTCRPFVNIADGKNHFHIFVNSPPPIVVHQVHSCDIETGLLQMLHQIIDRLATCRTTKDEMKPLKEQDQKRSHLRQHPGQPVHDRCTQRRASRCIPNSPAQLQAKLSRCAVDWLQTI